MTVEVSTIVVSFNTRELTRACLESVYQKTNGLDFEVIVVDNASTDGSATMIKELFPNVRLIESNRNLGFAAANNLAFNGATGKYVFLLNPDTKLLNNAIRMFYEFMEEERNLEVGVVGAYLLDERMRIRHSYGAFASLRDFRYYLSLRGLFPRNLRRSLKSSFASRHPGRLSAASEQSMVVRGFVQERPVDYVTGADLFIRRSVLDEVGVFDEHYFLYAEEMDLQYRMSRSGYKRVIIDGPKVMHLKSRSVDTSQKRALLESAKLEFLRKHFPVKYAVCRLACTVATWLGNR